MGSVPPLNMIQHAGYTMTCPPSKMPHQMPHPPSRGRNLLPAVSRRGSRGPPPHSSRGPPPHSSRGAPPNGPSAPHTARTSRDLQRTHTVEKVECLTPGCPVRHRRARPQRILGDGLDGFLNKTDPQNMQVVYRAPQFG